jgi:hypothetical protein
VLDEQQFGLDESRDAGFRRGWRRVAIVACMSATVLRRVQIGLLTVGVLVTIMMAVMVAGSYRDDALIDDDKATAVADVVSASPTKATVSFSTPDGIFRSPRLGVFYPGRLTEGQRISIEYSSTNPELVRVAGRDASLSILPALSVLVYSWLAIAAIMVLLAETHRRRANGRSPTVRPPVTASQTS